MIYKIVLTLDFKLHNSLNKRSWKTGKLFSTIKEVSLLILIFMWKKLAIFSKKNKYLKFN